MVSEKTRRVHKGGNPSARYVRTSATSKAVNTSAALIHGTLISKPR